jgi:GDP-4-dehydro-6-deoxy-D-mannose reductase
MDSLGRVLVTGARGFVGGHLVEHLRDRCTRLSGFGLETDPGGMPLDGWHVGDLRDPDVLRAVMAAERPQAVVHLAARSSAAASFDDPAGTFDANTLGTWRLLEAVRLEAPSARVLLVGTSEVYGPQPPGTRVKEDAPFRPVSPYALSKAGADSAGEVAYRRYGLDVVRTRSFGHTGPGQSTRFFLPSMVDQIARAEAGLAEPVLKVGNLDVVRDLTDVRDVVVGYRLLLERGRSGAAYNVCRGEGVRLADVITGVVARARIALRIDADPARMRPVDVAYLVGDGTRMTEDTGWSATRALDETAAEMLDAARAKVTSSHAR